MSPAMPKLIKSILVIYPFVTMLLLLLASFEMSIRKFMYYRLMSLGVLVDWDNAGARAPRATGVSSGRRAPAAPAFGVPAGLLPSEPRPFCPRPPPPLQACSSCAGSTGTLGRAGC